MGERIGKIVLNTNLLQNNTHKFKFNLASELQNDKPPLITRKRQQKITKY